MFWHMLLLHGLIKVHIRLTFGARAETVLGQHSASSVSATGLVLAHVWATSGKPDLGHHRAVILCGTQAMCKHIVWDRSRPYQFCYVGGIM